MSENLQNLLGEFVKEAGLDSVASAIVDLDGKELAYIIHGTFDKEFNSQRAASVFAMVVNFLNKTLGGIHFEEDEVEEIVVFNELIAETKKEFRNFTTIGGIRQMVNFPYTAFRYVSVKGRRKMSTTSRKMFH